MKLILVITTVCVLNIINAFCQDTSAIVTDTILLQKPQKTNPIIYAGVGIGGGIAGMTGFMGNFDLNYQFKQNIITARLVLISNFSVDLYGAPLFLLPIFQENGSLEEPALLYGRRFIKNGHGINISAGVSHNKWVVKYNDADGNRQRTEEKYIGLPFEVAINWFKSQKRRYRVYGLVPVGKPTGFGNSIGFKLSGNISRHSYAALSLVLGIGYHKVY